MKKLILVMLIVSFLSVGCTIGPEEEEGFEEGELNYLITEAGTVTLPLTKYNTLNPLINKNESYFHLSKLIFEGLFDYDDKLQPVPRLAEAYDLDDEGNIHIKLREDVLWHDGEKFTSSDVKFTIDALRYGEENIYYNLIDTSIDLNSIVLVNIIDEFNLEISFRRTSPNILGLLTFPILAEHGFDNHRMALSEDFIPMGTGPFKFNNTSRSKDIELLSYEDYRFDKPRIEKVVGRVLDEDLFITSFEAGQIDITTTSQVDWDKYKQNNSIDVIEYTSSDYEFLGFNFSNDIFAGENGQAIRKAIIYGIDRQRIIENNYLGHASQVDAPIHPNSWLITESINTYGYDPETSRRYLEYAGFKDLDGDGILEDELGNKLIFRYLTNPSNPYRKRTAELIKEDLNEIGIEIIADYDLDMLNDEWSVINGKVEKSDFDILQLGLGMSVIPDLGHLFHSNGKNNFIKYSSEEMDSIITNYEFQRSGKDTNEKLIEHIVDELPYISLFYKNEALLFNKKIIGELNPTYFNLYNGLENCFTTVKGQ